MQLLLKLSLSTVSLDLRVTQKQARVWRDGSISGALAHKQEDRSLTSSTRMQKLAVWHTPAILEPGRWGQEAALASRPSLTGELQIQRKPV